MKATSRCHATAIRHVPDRRKPFMWKQSYPSHLSYSSVGFSPVGNVTEAAAWADTVRIFASHLTISEDPLVCVVVSLPSLSQWLPDGRTLLVAPLFSLHHAQALSQVSCYS
ncbi:hypothetical protein E2C01_045167 [Portunus trituberculatus]|uniref:Uncharacterized protein n=1 Tax=Portunus trituberculatus TaxID=210409 RepID=A0A5B7FXK0_PORTR|nr:hypothetical protein [Portunus trituberculatus]